MKLKFLLFCIACLVVENNDKPLLAHNSNENIASTIADGMYDEIFPLTETIGNLLMHGYSTDEIITMLKHKYPNPHLEKLVTKIQAILNKQQSPGDAVKILVNNKEAEEFYAQENASATLQNIYFVVKTIAILMMGIITAYCLYRMWTQIRELYDKVQQCVQLLQNCFQQVQECIQMMQDIAQHPIDFIMGNRHTIAQ